VLRDGISLQGGGQQQSERLAVIPARPRLTAALDGFVEDLNLGVRNGRVGLLRRLQLEINLRRSLLLDVGRVERVKLGFVTRRRGRQRVYLIPGVQLIMTLRISPGLLWGPVGAGTVGIIIHPRPRDRGTHGGIRHGAADYKRRRRLSDLLLDLSGPVPGPHKHGQRNGQHRRSNWNGEDDQHPRYNRGHHLPCPTAAALSNSLSHQHADALGHRRFYYSD
jgi:hypothetical protein